MRVLKSIGSILIAMSGGVVFAQCVNNPTVASIVATAPGPGAQITVTGTGFGATPGVLEIAGIAVEPIAWSDTVITAIVPAAAARGPVLVMREDPGPPAQKCWSNGDKFADLTAAPVSPPSASGIAVQNVRVYDNALLQQMLDADRSRLTGLQFLNQTAIAANIGSIQGASMTQSGLSIAVSGPQVPGISTVQTAPNAQTTLSQGVSNQNTGATVSVTNTSAVPSTSTPPSSALTVTAPTSSSTLTSNNSTQLNGPTTQTTLTLAQPPSPIPAAAPGGSFTAPSGYSPSASSILNEQVQLNSEVAGLALMMEGSQADQVFFLDFPGSGSLPVQKHHVTLGIPIDISPRPEDKDAVAEIVVTFKANPNLFPSTFAADDKVFADVLPSITAMLPQDKTYNTATISSHSFSLGAGVVTGVLTAGMNYFWQKQTYYVVQAQDMVAFQLASDPKKPDEISFGWDIRPVLGSRTVLSGLRTLFVQLSVASLEAKTYLGSVSVTTRWKRLNKKLSIVTDEVFDEGTDPRIFPIWDRNPGAKVLDIDDPVDNGDGTVSVHVTTSYTPNSTAIRIGSTVIPQGATNAQFLHSGIDFTVSSALLANQKASLINGISRPVELVEPEIGAGATLQCLDVFNGAAVPESATSAIVSARLVIHQDCNQYINDLSSTPISQLHLIAVMGGKVFGYRDAPITFDDAASTISFHAPLDLIRTAPTLTVKRLFYGSAVSDTFTLQLAPAPVIEKATVVKKTKDNLLIALMGSNLMQLRAPADMAFRADGKTCSTQLPGFSDTDTGRMLCVSGKLLPSLSQAALTSTSGDLLLVELPSPAKPTTTGPTLQPQGYLDAGVAINLTVRGTQLDKFDHVEIEKKTVPSELAPDKGSILVHLTADMVKAPKVVLVFFFKGSPNVSYTVNVNKKAG
jgi:hypothetical protein